MSNIDKELKALLKESEQITFNEYCKTCYQNKMCCDTCNSIVNGEPVHYLSANCKDCPDYMLESANCKECIKDMDL